MAVTRSAGKRRRVSRNEYWFDENDRISILPDAILLTILEKLPLKNACTTAGLARRWRNLWKSLSSVELNYPVKDRGTEATKFMKSFMGHYKGDRLNRFSVSVGYEKIRVSAYESWMAFALSKNIEELSLELNICKYQWQSRLYPIVPVPNNIFKCSSLVRVKLTFADLNPLPPFHLKSLKDLHLSKSQLPDDGIRNITAHCPQLQILTLSNCNKDQHLKVNVSPDSPLSRIIIDDRDRQVIRLHETSINAPKITVLEMLASTNMRKYSIVDVADVVEATLILEGMPRLTILQQDTENQIRANIAALLMKLQAVKMLHVCRRCIMTVVRMKESDLKFNLTRLALDTHLESCDVLGIILLLKACPRLEQLVLSIKWCSPQLLHAYGTTTLLPLGIWRSGAYSLEGCLQRLSVLEFKRLEGPYQTWDLGNFEMDKFMGSQNRSQLVKHLVSSLLNPVRIVFTTAQQQFELSDGRLC